MKRKLEVRDLRISFRTINGKVQAVRGINFDLYEKDTLAIVGESGSGKSVTSKAILGILAGNSIIEGGEVIYDGKNLLTLSEEEFQKIRGDKIAMIFQDPLSSLNPIMKIGKQLTEAMLLKGKLRQKESRRNFNSYLALLNENMIKAEPEVLADELTTKCKNFDKFEYKHLELENAYNVAHESAIECKEEAEDLAFEIGKNVFKDVKYRINQVYKFAKASVHTYVVNDKKQELLSIVSTIKSLAKEASSNEKSKNSLLEALNKISSIMKDAIKKPMPNFFTMGYYLTFSDKGLPEMDVESLNHFLREYLDNEYMLDFIEHTKKAITYSHMESRKRMAEVLSSIGEYKEIFSSETPEKNTWYSAFDRLSNLVWDSIDQIQITKENVLYTFRTSFKNTIDKYFNAIKKNVKEQKRFDKQDKKVESLKAKGKEPSWKVVPLSLIDLKEVQNEILHHIDRLEERYKEILAIEKDDFSNDSIAVIDFLKECASGVVNKITKSMAKSRALKLMSEVGISEPRIRYNQYPFEFSGGMRQRIVIAIALAADPDVLICDEPTTALDVTIQAQILELINELKERRKLAVIFITHDLGVVANMADRIAVMYAGKIVEYGTSMDIFYHPQHPYTWALLASMPDLDTNEKLDAIPGTPPNMIYPPKGDAFAERNKNALKIDFEMQPPMFKVSDTHYAATWLLHPSAPKVNPPKIVTDRIERMKKLNAEYLKENGGEQNE